MSELTTLFQYNTLGALLSGLYDGSLTIAELLEQGDLGIGTLDGIDGELIVLDGKAYQAKSIDGKLQVIQVLDQVKVPYAAVATHQSKTTFKQEEELANRAFAERLESYFETKNLFYSIKIHGTFSRMRVRTIIKSSGDIPFVELASQQPEFEVDHVVGTIVGFWTPDMFHGASLAGFHFHFLSDDRTFGGHILDYVIRDGVVELCPIDQLNQRFPTKDSKFLAASFDLDQIKGDMVKSE